MAKSMTAYGRALVSATFGRLTAEIQSINRKYLDILIFLPRELSHFEPFVRNLIASRIARGQVTVRISAAFDQQLPYQLEINIPLARQLKEGWDRLTRDLSLTPQPESIWHLFSRHESLWTYQVQCGDEELYRSALESVILQALVPFEEMKKAEGSALTADMQARLKTIEQNVILIAEKTPNATMRYRERLLKA